MLLKTNSPPGPAIVSASHSPASTMPLPLMSSNKITRERASVFRLSMIASARPAKLTTPLLGPEVRRNSGVSDRASITMRSSPAAPSLPAASTARTVKSLPPADCCPSSAWRKVRIGSVGSPPKSVRSSIAIRSVFRPATLPSSAEIPKPTPVALFATVAEWSPASQAALTDVTVLV